jgi:hypothetical protein
MWAGLLAWWKAIAGRKQVVWQPTQRLSDAQCLQAAAHALQPLSLGYRVHPELAAESAGSRGAEKSQRDLAAVGEKPC